LKDGLRTLLAMVTNATGKPFDLSKMSIGTVHSICRRILTDRRFAAGSIRPRPPDLMDELDQYFHIYRRWKWNELVDAGRFYDADVACQSINQFISGSRFWSRHHAVSNCTSLFNRFSEECLDPRAVKKRVRDSEKRRYLSMYSCYLNGLSNTGPFGTVDLSLLQQKALNALGECSRSESVFEHVIVDEYQDTNTVQERIFFKLAGGSKNICVVGDDDQALYRFRGATVENLVEFPKRCLGYLGTEPHPINLDVNYRSRHQIVENFKDFIGRCDWKREDKSGYYRVHDKKLRAFRKDKRLCVIASSPKEPEYVYDEIARLTKKIVKSKKVDDPNQIAFLFPAIRNNTRVKGFKAALENPSLPILARH